MNSPILALDIDGVIVEGFPRKRWDATLKADLGISPKHLQQTFFKPHWRDVLLGNRPVEEPLGEFLSGIGSDISTTEFLAYWHGRDANLRHDVIDAAKKWQERTAGMLALATNQDSTRATYLLETLGLGEHFETMIVSCVVGAVKPEPAFFKEADKLLHREPGQKVIFIDDLADNVESAANHGWQAHHAQNPDAALSLISTLQGPRRKNTQKLT
jgi:putative hydrolase of the HAD superfamily